MSLTYANGETVRPLTEHAISELAGIRREPCPSQYLNSGVVNRLLVEGLVETVQLPSPYASHKGRSINHLKITAAGVARLEEIRNGR